MDEATCGEDRAKTHNKFKWNGVNAPLITQKKEKEKKEKRKEKELSSSK